TIHTDEAEIEPLTRVFGVRDGAVLMDVRAEQTRMSHVTRELGGGRVVFEVDDEVVVPIECLLASYPLQAAYVPAETCQELRVRPFSDPCYVVSKLPQQRGCPDDVSGRIEFDNENVPS